MPKGLLFLIAVVTWLGCSAPEQSSVPKPNDVGDSVRRVLDETKYANQTGEALKALQALGPAAVPALLESLESEGALTRETAARALGRLKEPRAVEPVLELFEQRHIPDWAALEAIPSIGTAATEILLQHLERHKDDAEIAPRLLRMVQAIRDPNALPVLLRLYPDRNEWVRTQIAETVRATSPETYARELAPREYERIETAFEHDPVRFALEACGLAQHYEPGMELLRRALRHSDPAVRGATLDCDPPLGGRAEALLPELSDLLATRPLQERFEAIVDTRGLGEALKFVDAHLVRRPPRVGAGDYRYEPFEAQRGAAEPFWAREPSCPQAPYTLGASDNLLYDAEYEVVVKVPGRSALVRGPGRWPAANDPDVAREVTVFGEGQTAIGTLNRVEWACADPCGEVAVRCSWEARYWTGHRGWRPQLVLPGRHEAESADVSEAGAVTEASVGAEMMAYLQRESGEEPINAAFWTAGPLLWTRDGGWIHVFADGTLVSKFFGDYGGPHFEILGRLGPASSNPYAVRIVGKFWETDAVIHRAGETWHSHEGPVHDMGGTCEDAGEAAFLVARLAPVGNWEWPWLAVDERNGNAELVWEPSSSASGPDVPFRVRSIHGLSLGPLPRARFQEGCGDVASGAGWPAPGSSCTFGLGDHKRYRLTSIASDDRHSLVLEREAPIAARQVFLLLPPGVAPSEVSLIFAGDLDGDAHVDLVVSVPVCDCPSKDRHLELLVSNWGDRFQLLENPMLTGVAQYVGSPSEN